MKLTKRGKRVRAVGILIALALAVAGVQFFLTHHTENTTCNQTDIGLACDYIWVKN